MRRGIENDPGVSYHGQGEIPVREDERVPFFSDPEEYVLSAEQGKRLAKGGLVLPETDMVNHPPHYANHPSGVECIDVIEWFTSPNLANVVKYVWRVDSGGKWDDIEDLRKAEFYLKREIERRARKNEVAR